MRGECYRKLDKYIQATFDFQKSIDIASEQVYFLYYFIYFFFN